MNPSVNTILHFCVDFFNFFGIGEFRDVDYPDDSKNNRRKGSVSSAMISMDFIRAVRIRVHCA
jgi:hypothetical protein